MTGLPNREAFFDALKDAIKSLPENVPDESSQVESILEDVILQLLLFDIDWFKQINDTCGHSYGDVVLKVISQRLESYATTARDTYGVRISIGHLSGEEFAAVVTGPITVAMQAEIADGFRSIVGGTSLPSDSE